MFRCFYPDHRKHSAYEIPYESLYQKGYRGIIFDIDNTLVEHDADADERAVALFERLKGIGFRSCLLSNNDQERVERFNRVIQTDLIWKAGKPARKNYLHAMELMNTTRENTLFVGDQLFTDVWGAKRTGIRNILVSPIDPREELQIVLKRYLERIVLYFYEKDRKKRKRMEQ